jgi:hypothetical protein
MVKNDKFIEISDFINAKGKNNFSILEYHHIFIASHLNQYRKLLGVKAKKICFKHFENVILMHHLEQECNLRHFSFLVNKKTRVNDKFIFQFLDKVTFLELQ